MSTTKHTCWTPGPWKVINDELSDFMFDVVAENANGDPEIVAHIRPGQPRGDDKANARLISKAPEMAELLKDLADGHHVSRDDAKRILCEAGVDL